MHKPTHLHGRLTPKSEFDRGYSPSRVRGIRSHSHYQRGGIQYQECGGNCGSEGVERGKLGTFRIVDGQENSIRGACWSSKNRSRAWSTVLTLMWSAMPVTIAAKTKGEMIWVVVLCGANLCCSTLAGYMSSALGIRSPEPQVLLVLDVGYLLRHVIPFPAFYVFLYTI